MSVPVPAAPTPLTPLDDLGDLDELALIHDEAASLGLPAPTSPVARVRLAERISALRWGTGPASVVLLHGAGLNAHTWDGVLARWGVDALALDLPGHGRSAWREDGDYSPAVLAGPVAAALAEARATGLVTGAPVLVGQSLGGLTALVAARSGVPTTHVLLVDVLPLPPEAGAQVAAFLAGPESFPSREAIVDRALAFGLGGARDRLERAVLLNTRVLDDGSVAWRHHLGLLAARGELRLRTGDDEVWTALRELDVPVDVVRGDRGIVGPDLVDRLTVERPAARVVTLPAGHNVQEDEPVALADALAALRAPYLP